MSTRAGAPSAGFSPQPLPAESSISALLSDGGRVFAAGRFRGFGDVPRPHFAIFAADGAGATTTAPAAGGGA